MSMNNPNQFGMQPPFMMPMYTSSFNSAMVPNNNFFQQPQMSDLFTLNQRVTALENKVNDSEEKVAKMTGNNNLKQSKNGFEYQSSLYMM